ncbi:hypothetical protein VE03_06038 [Pseudogymnoascus sp. 23342-1-I1]|nr:hypothetical protein VE03_06038 [Pseudogymnoascus sp. 23342-1-I1]
MVVTLCAVANSAGPESAILMIPPVQTIDRAGFDFFLNGTSDELWPSTLESQHIGGAVCINTDAAATDASCIGGGYPTIYNHFTAFTQQPQSSSFNFDTEDRLGQRTILGNIRNAWSGGSETWTQSSHSAIMMIAEPIRAMWSFNLRYLTDIWEERYDYSDNQDATVEGQVPAVRVACVPTQNLSSQSSVAFPVFEETISTLGSQQFGSTSAGLLIATSSKLENSTTFNLGMACSIDARWALGITSMSGTRSGWAFASDSKPTVSEISNTRALLNDYGGMRHLLPIDDGSWRRITITPPWLQSLTPPVPGSTGTTTLEAILEHTIPININLNNIQLNTLTSYFTNTSNSLVPIAEHIISVLVTDGIFRVGSALPLTPPQSAPTYQLIPFPPNSPSTTQMHLRTTVDGYAYRFVGRTGTFAAIVIGAHMAIVVLHYINVVFRRPGKWSDSWESFSGVLALAMNSPVGVEGEKSAGIEKLDTLALMVGIRAANGAVGGAVDGVKLVVGGGVGGISGNEVQSNVAYGNPATTPWTD